MPVGDTDAGVVVVREVGLAVRTIGVGGDVTERDVGDRRIEAGPAAVVGDLVVALGADGVVPPDTAWAALVLADGTVAGVDEPVASLAIRRGDRLVVALGPAERDGDVVLAFGPRRPPARRFALRVVSPEVGPCAGAVVVLPPGQHGVGRADDGNVLVLPDPSVSRRHAVLTVDERVSVADAGSTNGTLIDGRPVGAGRRLGVGERLSLGEVELEVVEQGSSDSPDLVGSGVRAGEPAEPSIDGRVVVRPSPMVVPPVRSVVLTAPELPPAAEEHRWPLLSLSVPVVLAAVLLAAPMFMGGLGGSYALLSAAFLLLSPVMMAATFWEAKRHTRRRHRRALAAFDAALAEVADRGAAAVTEELSARIAAHPPLSTLQRRASRAEIGLWSVADRGNLTLRLGTAETATEVRLQSAGGGTVARGPGPWTDDAPAHRLALLADALGRHDAAPFTVGRGGVISFVGDPEWVAGLARAAALRLATDLPPHRLRIGLDLAAGAAAWEWLEWLPHTVVTRDLAAAGATGAGELLLVTDADDVVVPEGGTVLWLGRHRSSAPSGTATLVERIGDADGGARVTDVDSGTVVDLLAADAVGREEADRWVRRLAPCAAAGTTAEAGRLPVEVGLDAVLPRPEVVHDPAAVVASWRLTDRSLSAPVGLGHDGVVRIDLRRDGPHAVVAGTTGAGKSEFLQTWVASLAVAHPPGRLNFLLVDYKGGSAFAECASLPHTVGLVTDLDEGLVERVLVSLRAELRRRESILAAAGAKDLGTMEERGGPGIPPSLVIVIDEFASITAEVPGFIDGMVDIARRGRSLGLHLVLATQRPTGVITDHLLANANLRIALRVSDPHESTDLVGVPDAATISRSTPGRGVVRLGAGEVVHLHAAFSGARQRAAAASMPDPRRVVVTPFSTTGDGPAGGAGAGRVEPPPGPTDLERLAASMRAAAASIEAARPRRPWLDPLPDELPLGTFVDHPSGELGVALPLGLVDDPARQTQEPRWLDLAGGAVLIHGRGAAVVAFVSSLVVAAVVGRSPAEVQVDIIDSDGGHLRPLAALPQVGSVVAADDLERIGRLMRQLTERLGGVESADGARPVRIVVIDDVAGFATRTEAGDGGAAVDALTRLVASGAAVGVHVVLVAGRRAGVPPAAVAGVAERVVMSSTTEDDLAALGIDAGLMGRTPGRAVVDGLAVQTPVLDVDGDWSLAGVVERECRRLGAMRAPELGALPDVVPAAILRDATGRGRRSRWGPVLLGLSDLDLAPVHVDLAAGNLLVAGPMRSGRSTALGAMAASLVQRAAPPRRLLVAPRGTTWTAAPVWDEVAVGRSALEMLRRTRSAAEGCGPATVVFVDDSTELDEEVDEELALLAALSRDADVRLVAAAESVLARRAYGGLVAELRRERRALLLQPDVDLDGDLAGVRLARRSSRPAPPGRGELVDRGHVALVQVALVSPDARVGASAARRSLFRTT